MAENGVSFAGEGMKDVTISKSGTNPPTAGKEGKDGGVQFVGEGSQDIAGNSTDTKQHDPSVCYPDKTSGPDIQFANNRKD